MPWGRRDVPPVPPDRDYAVVLGEAMAHSSEHEHYVRVQFETYAPVLANPVYVWDCDCRGRR